MLGRILPGSRPVSTGLGREGLGRVRLATIVIDMLNPYDHEDGEALAAQAADRIEPITS